MENRGKIVRSISEALRVGQEKFIVRSIREALRETQAKFSERLGTSQSMIARWENGRQLPTESWMLKIKDLAIEAGLIECSDGIGNFLMRKRAKPKIEVRTEEEVDLVNAVLLIARHRAEYAAEFKELGRITERARKHNRQAIERAQNQLDFAGAIVRLHKRGNSPAEISAVLGIDEESVNVRIGISELQEQLSNVGFAVIDRTDEVDTTPAAERKRR
jgi:transcriptional regulator with XRE-family HTH domain